MEPTNTPQSQFQESPHRSLLNRKEIQALLGILLVAAVMAVTFYFYKSKTDTVSEVDFSMVVKADKVFSAAVEKSRSGQAEESKQLLEQELLNVKDPKIIGLYKLWIALAVGLADPKEYARELLEVATNEQYAPRTRTYAYFYLGSFFPRDTPTDILDVIVNDQRLSGERALSSTGSVNYRQTFVNILDKSNVEVADNPLVLAREASIILGGVERGEMSSEEMKKAIALVERSLPLEKSIVQEDTLPLYGIYLFLVAQVLGNGEFIDSGKYASFVTKITPSVDVGEWYNRAISLTHTTGDASVEASARINYARYLIEKYELGNSPYKTKVEISEKVDEILVPIIKDVKLQNTPAVQLLLSGNKTADDLRQKTAQKLGSYSIAFKAFLSKN